MKLGTGPPEVSDCSRAVPEWRGGVRWSAAVLDFWLREWWSGLVFESENGVIE
jgi:hypothetical protein